MAVFENGSLPLPALKYRGVGSSAGACREVRGGAAGVRYVFSFGSGRGFATSRRVTTGAPVSKALPPEDLSTAAIEALRKLLPRDD
ncbi:MAG: hypothetical protein RID07_05100 [Lacipirellulaceae bacterium]